MGDPIQQVHTSIFVEEGDVYPFAHCERRVENVAHVEPMWSFVRRLSRLAERKSES